MKEEEIHDRVGMLVRAIARLVSTRNAQGHWGDVRSTALACWAINEAISARQDLNGHDQTPLHDVVDDSRTWLAGQAKREEGGVSWESEAWDTALAVLALAPESQYAERLDLAIAWLRRIADPETGSWYQEVWETTLVAVALLRREDSLLGPRSEDWSWLQRAVRWLCTIPSKASGEFICPHYSAFLVWLSNELAAVGLVTGSGGTTEFSGFLRKAAQAEDWLLQKARLDGQAPWTGYTFSNSYVLYALARGAKADRLPLSGILQWFARRQGQHGGFEDTEDTSLAVLAFGAAFRKSGIPVSLPLSRLGNLATREVVQKPKCFLGYSGGSKALALELKEFMSNMLPDIDLRDWRWDFVPGRHLFAEIEAVSQDCRLAIFLVTKDDELSDHQGALRFSPRDNIVFEIGFFAARIGIESTILVVEQGTKVPTDLAGILYIPLRDRSDLSHVTMPLLSTIRRILSVEHR